MGYFSLKNDRIMVNVKVSAGMRENGIVSIKNDEVMIRIKAQAEKDKANKELVKYLAKLLGVSRTEIEIISGAHSQHKIISLPKSVKPIIERIGADLWYDRSKLISREER